MGKKTKKKQLSAKTMEQNKTTMRVSGYHVWMETDRDPHQCFCGFFPLSLSSLFSIQASFLVGDEKEVVAWISDDRESGKKAHLQQTRPINPIRS